MKAGEAIAEILKREGVEIIFGYPVNHVLEFAARAGIRPIIVRQERVGLHMADAMSRLTSGASRDGGAPDRAGPLVQPRRLEHPGAAVAPLPGRCPPGGELPGDEPEGRLRSFGGMHVGRRNDGVRAHGGLGHRAGS